MKRKSITWIVIVLAGVVLIGGVIVLWTGNGKTSNYPKWFDWVPNTRSPQSRGDYEVFETYRFIETLSSYYDFWELEHPEAANQFDRKFFIDSLLSKDMSILTSQEEERFVNGSSLLQDYWGEELRFTETNGVLERIASCGPNRVWEDGNGDDIVVEIGTKEE